MSTSRPDVFLSYSREDQARARRFAEALAREGFKVWWDQALSAGEAYDEVTEAALEGAHAVVVLWSRTSVASRWVRAEATTADRLGTLVPVMIEPCKRPIMFELRQTAELGAWTGDPQDPAWRTFVADLKRKLPGTESAVEPASGSLTASVPSVSSTPARSARPVRILATMVVVGVIAAVAGAFWMWRQAVQAREARAAVPEVATLVDAGDFSAAFARAQQIRNAIPDDPMLKSLTPLFTARYDITSTPEGADVYVRGYEAAKEEWQHLGRTPLKSVDLPRRVMRWRIEKDGFEPVERASTPLPKLENVLGTYLAESPAAMDVVLHPVGEQPPEMVYVPGGRAAVGEVPPFFIDRHEVTNAQFREFVAAGGYDRRNWWQDLDMRRDGKPLPVDEAMLLFVDSTGRPGPARWELGTWPEGQQDHPVTGISWYEASAYARFRGSSLPTIHQWDLAAFPATESPSSLVASAAPLSNFGTAGPAPVGRYQGVGPYGTYDMFGNVREWIQNPNPEGGGWSIGGNWEDAIYAFRQTDAQSLLERSPQTGIRLVRNISEPADAGAMVAPVDLLGSQRGTPPILPVSDEVYATYARQFAYRPGPLNATAPATVATTGDWTKQRVTIDTGYNGERMDIVLFVPRNARPPFQPVIVVNGSQIFLPRMKSADIEPGMAALPLDFVVKSGRVLVEPVLQGAYDRHKEGFDRGDELQAVRTFTEWRWDIGRTIDYLETRPDIDASRAGYIGLSFGSSSTLPLLALEPRLRAAVLYAGGLLSMPSPTLDLAAHAPRIRIPVLMVNGRYDQVFPVETHQEPLFRLLGSPPTDKKHVLLDSAHGSPPRAPVLKETLAWFDEHLGPVNR